MATEGERDATPFGLLGRKLGHSWSPQIHAALGSWPYRLVELEPDEVEPFVRGREDWQGLNVTIPYKAEAARLADARSERVSRLGVANTLVRRKDGTIFADNTDVLGFSWLLEDFCRRELGASAREALGGREAIVLGSGGASRAVVPVLRDAGCRTSVISRTGEDTYETLLERHADAALVVNTTPVGTYPDCPASPLAPGVLERMGSLAGVVDVVYNPERTGICLEAERLGIPSQSGLGMLVSQAYFASQLFQGRSLPSRLVGDISQDIAHKSRNIALIGMPGVGKTTTGRQLARIENRPFVDLDDAFEIAHGMSAAECIERRGEEEFRRLETEVCANWCSRSGLVVSCGGGIVTRPENYALLHQNATIVMLERPIEELSQRGRPLSQDRGVEELARQRMHLYQQWADLRIQCTGSPQGDAREILSALGRPVA